MKVILTSEIVEKASVGGGSDDAVRLVWAAVGFAAAQFLSSNLLPLSVPIVLSCVRVIAFCCATKRLIKYGVVGNL